ncbi:MAG: SDR family oxidoreductase [Ilumatobacter sp.]|jgi:enoyl-[acyl-carrier protein] reductase III|uniref:SDR family oxidoreductase n=1 Tax=Ilumatobacter sp. TaxID=1967498 RepID=UPI00391B438C
MSILITGGTKGIGLGIAERFAGAGVTVFLNYASDDEAAEKAAALIESSGGTPVLLKRDISDAASAAALLEDVAAHTERLDQLVHAAVYPYATSLLNTDPAELDRAVALNGTALVHLTRSALPLLKPGATVFFLSSRGSKVAVPNYGPIGGPKAMGEAFIRYLAIELAEHGVRAHVVSASLVLTDALRTLFGDAAEDRAAAAAAANPMKRNVTESDVAEVVHFLSTPASEMLNGRELFLDGGVYTKAN